MIRVKVHMYACIFVFMFSFKHVNNTRTGIFSFVLIYSREAVTKVRGSVAILQELSRNMNPRIRDHAEHALFNLRMLRHGGTGGGGSVHSTPVFGSETPRYIYVCAYCLNMYVFPYA